jgi:hypothetical protein
MREQATGHFNLSSTSNARAIAGAGPSSSGRRRRPAAGDADEVALTARAGGVLVSHGRARRCRGSTGAFYLDR